MPTDLHELLADAAARAPVPDPDAIWRAGRRRARRRRSLEAVGGVAVLVAAIAMGAVLWGPADPPDVGPVGIPGVDDEPRPPAGSGMIEIATLVDDRTVLQRPDGSRQDLPELVVGEAVMLRDGTFVYEAHPPMERLVGDPPLWALPPDGEPVLLDEPTAAPGIRRLVGRDETGQLPMIRVDSGDLEVWDLEGERIPVAGGSTLAAISPDALVSRHGFVLASAMPGAGAVALHSSAMGSQGHSAKVSDRGGVVALGHTPSALVVLVAGGEPGPEVVVLDPTTGAERARHGVPGTTAAIEVVGMSVTDGTVAVHRQAMDSGDAGWQPSAVLDLANGRWTDAATHGPAYLVGPPPRGAATGQATPDSLVTTVLVADPTFEGMLIRALQRPDGTRQELPAATTPLGGVMLADGTFMYEALDPEKVAPPTGIAPPLWALAPDGEPVLLDEAHDGRRLVGQSADGAAGLVLVDGTSLQRWGPDGDRGDAASLAGLDASSDLRMGMVALASDGGLAVQHGATRVSVRSGPGGQARQVAVTEGDQTVRAVLAIEDQLVAVVDGDAAETRAEVVVVDAHTGRVTDRIEVPGTGARESGVGTASGHAGWLAVHLVEVSADGKGEWGRTALMDLRRRQWVSAPVQEHANSSGPAHPHDR